MAQLSLGTPVTYTIKTTQHKGVVIQDWGGASLLVSDTANTTVQRFLPRKLVKTTTRSTSGEVGVEYEAGA